MKNITFDRMPRWQGQERYQSQSLASKFIVPPSQYPLFSGTNQTQARCTIHSPRLDRLA